MFQYIIRTVISFLKFPPRLSWAGNAAGLGFNLHASSSTANFPGYEYARHVMTAGTCIAIIGLPLSLTVLAAEAADAMPHPVILRRARVPLHRLYRTSRAIKTMGMLGWLTCYLSFALLLAGVLVADIARVPKENTSA